MTSSSFSTIKFMKTHLFFTSRMVLRKLMISYRGSYPRLRGFGAGRVSVARL